MMYSNEIVIQGFQHIWFCFEIHNDVERTYNALIQCYLIVPNNYYNIHVTKNVISLIGIVCELCVGYEQCVVFRFLVCLH